MHCGICEIGLSDLQLPILFWVATVLLFYIYILGLCSIRCVLRCVNSLAPSRWENNFKSVIFKLISEIDTLSNSYEIAVG